MAPEAVTSILKPRFKGIENFLRKIAFNLGNSPSQTSVKIISCIPIDVTDLQNKIVDLERELDERAGGETPPDNRNRPQARVAIGAPVYTPSPLFSDSIINAPALTPSTSLNAEPPSRVSLSEVESGPVRIPKPETVTFEDMQATTPSSIENFKPIQKKQTKIPKPKTTEQKRKGRTQMVYFAQTMYPKKMCKEGMRRGKLRGINEDDLSRTFLADVVHRQYRPEVMAVVDPASECSSAFSWPVCRDEPGPTARACCDSDVCSCCHGLFHNVDKAPDTQGALHRDYSVYYDSSLYDVVPVKESSRFMMNGDIYQKRQNDMFLTLEDDYFLKANKPRVQFQQPCVTRYCSVVSPHPPHPPYRPYPKTRCKKKLPNKSALKREQVIRAMQKRKHEHKLAADLSVSDCVDCGEVYTKPYNPVQRVVVSPPSTQFVPAPAPLPPPPVLKNAECLTNEREEYMSTSRSVQFEAALTPPPPPPPDNKTEITLNQIKSILHAVLTEVKTNAQLKIHNTILEDKTTKDAVVQNGPSHSNIATNSSYMNNYLYSPQYSFGPYGPSYSGQVAGSQGFYQPGSERVPPGLFGAEVGTSTRAGLYSMPGPSPCADAAKCVQNYPLFIHTTGRQCACCYRSTPVHQQPLAHPNTSPAHISTNTEANKNQERSKETNNLIKEIYKSLALNTSYPQKDTSSNFTDRTSGNASNKRIELKMLPKGRPKIVASEILHKGEKRPLFLNEREQLGSTAASYRSEVKTTTTTATTAASGMDTESATPRGDGVRSLMCAKKELVSTGSETPVSHRRDYSPSDRRGRKYSPDIVRDREYSAREKRDQDYDRRDRRYSPGEDRERKHSPTNDRGRKIKVPVLTTSVSDEDTATPSIEESEQSDTTVVEIEKKEKKGLFSKMKKLFTTRRRRKRDNDASSDIGQEPTSDSDDYETVYSERTTHSGERTRRRPPTPPLAPRRRRPHSKVSFRYNRRDAPTSRSPRYRREGPMAPQMAPASPPRPRRSPYMEQEYRRHWNEELAFHQGNTPQFSSERPFTRSGREFDYSKFDYSRYTSPPERPNPYGPYWKEYEARQALVPPPCFAPQAHAPPQYPPPHYPPPQGNLPPLRPPLAPKGCPYQPTQDQVNKGDQTVSVDKPMYLPQSYKPAATGLAWLKKFNMPGFQCGVQWKNFFLDG